MSKIKTLAAAIAATLPTACAAPFEPSLGPGAPMPGTYGSAPVVSNVDCAKAGEQFFQRPWQTTTFGGSRQRPDGNFEVILNNVDGRRALCIVSPQGAVLGLSPF